jgi:hypothetical protein
MTNRQKLEECLILLRDIQKWAIETTTVVKGGKPEILFPIRDDLRLRINNILDKKKVIYEQTQCKK